MSEGLGKHTHSKTSPRLCARCLEPMDAGGRLMRCASNTAHAWILVALPLSSWWACWVGAACSAPTPTRPLTSQGRRPMRLSMSDRVAVARELCNASSSSSSAISSCGPWTCACTLSTSSQAQAGSGPPRHPLSPRCPAAQVIRHAEVRASQVSVSRCLQIFL